MRKTVLVLLSLIIIAGMLAACGGASGTVENPILKVTGKIQEKNSGDAYALDEAAFEKNSVEQTMDDPWMGDGLKYKGILLSKLIELVKPASDATALSLVATDGKAIDIPIEDANQWGIMLAHWSDGTVLDEKTGGPVKVAFPAEARQKYADEQWMWWIVEVKVK
ncbi:MAG: molybdopterin-dependent oxidoreductase [Chloroflexi bacterium]|jgi:hypothetical protein|nr:molybdopterin-dependent oxidoreductase [Chloroflexota bacterium]